MMGHHQLADTSKYVIVRHRFRVFHGGTVFLRRENVRGAVFRFG
jgi:hypothetical protein